jgi:Polysaccharide deacetylase
VNAFDPDTVCITIDVEWAAPRVLEDTVRLLDERKVRATFFCTHPGIEVAGHERALHPNFCLSGETMQMVRPKLPTMTQSEVYRHVVTTTHGFCTEAIGTRGHRQFFDSALLPIYQECGVRYDSSCYLPFATGLQPAMKPYDVLELPVYFIDHSDLSDHRTGFQAEGLALTRPGLKVFDFHPNTLIINAATLDQYTASKACYHDYDQLLARRNPQRGVRMLFVELLDYLAEGHATVATLAEVNAAWRAARM